MRKKPYFLIKWRGYPRSQSTWEPIDNLEHCINFVVNWKKQKQRDEQKNLGKASSKGSKKGPSSKKKVAEAESDSFAEMVRSLNIVG